MVSSDKHSSLLRKVLLDQPQVRFSCSEDWRKGIWFDVTRKTFEIEIQNQQGVYYKIFFTVAMIAAF